MLTSRLLFVTFLCVAPLACNALFGVDELSYQETGAGGSSSSTTSTGTGGVGGIGGGTGGAAGAGGGGGGGAILAGYGYRRPLTIATSVDLPAAYSLAFDIDHDSWVDDGKARADGADVRVAVVQGGVPVVIDRVVEPTSSWGWNDTRLWFATQGTVSAENKSTYYVYYGQADPEDAAPADGGAVFTLWEDFEGPPPSGWTFTEIGSAVGSHEIAGGLLTLTSNGDHIFNATDEFVFYHRTIPGDFVARAHTVGASGDNDDWSNLGGVMVRADLSGASRNALVSPTSGPVSAYYTYRLADGAATDFAAQGNGMNLPTSTRIARLGDDLTGSFYTNTWITLGVQTFANALPEEVLVGIPHASSNDTMVGSAHVDWFLVRKLVSPEPVVMVGDEEQL